MQASSISWEASRYRRTDARAKFSRVQSSRPPVLVFGSGLTSLGTIRLLASAGLKPFVVSDTPGMVAKSRWYRPAPRSASSESPRDNLRAWLDGLPLDRAILLACSDEWALRVARYADSFRERFPTSVWSTAVRESMIEKARRPAVRTPLTGLSVCGDSAGGRGIGTELAAASAMECVSAVCADLSRLAV